MRETFVPLAIAALVLVSAWSSRDPRAVPQEPVAAQGPIEPPRSLDARLAWVLDRAWEERSLGSLVAFVELRGEVIARAARGELGDLPADATSPLPLGTASELVLALSVLHAAEERGVALDTPLAKLLPRRDLPWDDVTLDMVLRHTSGLGDVTPPGRAPVEASAPRRVSDDGDQRPRDGAAQDPERAGERAEKAPARRAVRAPWFDAVREVAVLAEPGERFDWSNTNVLLAHLWLEETTGQALERYAADALFPALDVRPRVDVEVEDDGDAERGARASSDASGEWTRARLDLGRLVREDAWWPPELQPADLELGAEQLLALVHAFEERGLLALDPGPAGAPPPRANDDDDRDAPDRDGARSRATRKDVERERDASDGNGYGWHATWLDNHAARAHGGAVGDVAVRIAHYPDLQLTVALTARGGTESLASLEQAVSRVVLDLPQPSLADLPLTQEELARYTGVYHVGSTRLVVAARDGRLELRTNEAVHALAFQGGERFLALDGRELVLVFEAEASGRATGFRMQRDGIDVNAVRFD